MNVLVPDVEPGQWAAWVAAHGGSPLALTNAERLPPGLRPLCEPEGFSFAP